MFYIIIVIIVLLALQIFLSLKNNKFVGLVLPVLTIITLIITLIGRAFKTTFFLSSILLVLLLLYFLCQKRLTNKKTNDISKMKINDL